MVLLVGLVQYACSDWWLSEGTMTYALYWTAMLSPVVLGHALVVWNARLTLVL